MYGWADEGSPSLANDAPRLGAYMDSSDLQAKAGRSMLPIRANLVSKVSG